MPKGNRGVRKSVETPQPEVSTIIHDYQPIEETNNGSAWLGFGMILASGAAMIYVVANDITGVGAADDALIPGIVSFLKEGWWMIFG